MTTLIAQSTDAGSGLLYARTNQPLEIAILNTTAAPDGAAYLNNNAGTDSVESLFDLNPLPPCPECSQQDCLCSKPKRKTKSNVIDLEKLKKEKRKHAWQQLQNIFKESLPRCQFD